MSLLSLLRNPVHVPNVIYRGLPWYCFFVTIIAWTTGGTSSYLLWTTAGLSIYAIVVLILRLINY